MPCPLKNIPSSFSLQNMWIPPQNVVTCFRAPKSWGLTQIKSEPNQKGARFIRCWVQNSCRETVYPNLGTPQRNPKNHGDYVGIVQDGRSPNQVFFGLLQVACCTYAIKIHRIPSNVSTFPVKICDCLQSNPLFRVVPQCQIDTQATNESTYGSKRDPLATGSFITVIPEGFFQCPKCAKEVLSDDMWIPREIYKVPR